MMMGFFVIVFAIIGISIIDTLKNIEIAIKQRNKENVDANHDS